MNLILYFFKVNAGIILFWMLFVLGLRKLTFFYWNRIFLLGSILIPFILPVIPEVLPWRSGSSVTGVAEIVWNAARQQASLKMVTEPVNTALIGSRLVPCLYICIASGIFFFRWFQLVVTLRRIQSPIFSRDSNTRLFEQDRITGSFTFFRRIYLDHRSCKENIQPVYMHERVHARQLHSVDLLLMECATALLWINPFIYRLKRYMVQNHEFLADLPAKETTESLVDYLRCLKVMSFRNVSPWITSNFNNSTIKKRIMMLTSRNSNPIKKFRYLVSALFIAALFVVFQYPGLHAAPGTDRLKPELVPAHVKNGDLASPPTRFPMDDQYRDDITWGYGEKRIHPFTNKETVHKGLDIKAPTGTKVYAAGDGVVESADDEGDYGNLVVIKHADGYESFYAHLASMEVEAGSKVAAGQVIGTVGTSGLSTGPHLHYELHKEGIPVNPSDYF